MNVYVETNFVLELAFDQEQKTQCELILNLCETGKINLIIPAYCLAEPHEKLTRQANHRKELQRSLDNELVQLRRTKSYSNRVGSIQNIASLLVQSTEEEKVRFIKLRARFLKVAEIIPLTIDILREAANCEAPYDLDPQDAIVFASVISHLQKNPSVASCFLNKNIKDFDTPDIEDALKKNKCKMLPRFDSGHNFIMSKINTIKLL
ncbi:MAG: PIN domain-containing protein [Methylococcaceae bacterium]